MDKRVSLKLEILSLSDTKFRYFTDNIQIAKAITLSTDAYPQAFTVVTYFNI